MATVVAMAFPAKVRAMKRRSRPRAHHRTGVLHLADGKPDRRRLHRLDVGDLRRAEPRLDEPSRRLQRNHRLGDEDGEGAARHRRVEGVADQTGRRVTVPDGLAHACVVGTDLVPDREVGRRGSRVQCATRSAGACAVVASVYVVVAPQQAGEDDRCGREDEQHRRHDLEGATLTFSTMPRSATSAVPRHHAPIRPSSLARGPARRLRGTARQGRRAEPKSITRPAALAPSSTSSGSQPMGMSSRRSSASSEITVTVEKDQPAPVTRLQVQSEADGALRRHAAAPPLR